MDQGVLDFARDRAEAQPRPAFTGVDQAGFEIGWDHARHGIVPPFELLAQDTAVGLGWHAGRAVLGRRTTAQPRHLRVWLALRLEAWQAGMPVEPQSLSATALRGIEASHCPVLRVPLGGPAGSPHAATVQRLNPALGFVPGNLVMLSRAAAAQAAATDVAKAALLARESANTGGSHEGMTAAAWWRLAALRALATPLPFGEAVRLPLVLLAAPGSPQPVNDAQELQMVISRWFLQAGWSGATRRLAAKLHDTALRHDFNLFVGALVARVLETPACTPQRRLAVEDAWLDARVQRRWQHFMLSLGDARAPALLTEARQAEMAGGPGHQAACRQGFKCCARKASTRR